MNSSILNISEASSLGMHAGVILAVNPDKFLSTKEISSKLKVSAAHMSKVLQRLVKTGIVKSIRGPAGGFVLAKKPDRITLLNIFEAIEGTLRLSDCLFDGKNCALGKCMLGNLIPKINKEVKEHLKNTALADLTPNM